MQLWKTDDTIIDATISMVLFRETMSQGLAIKRDEFMKCEKCGEEDAYFDAITKQLHEQMMCEVRFE